jgi:hypothetical protein
MPRDPTAQRTLGFLLERKDSCHRIDGMSSTGRQNRDYDSNNGPHLRSSVGISAARVVTGTSHCGRRNVVHWTLERSYLTFI